MKFRRAKKPSTALDISPLIDVVLQLLIFFMLSSTFMSPRIQIALPEATTSDGPGDAAAVVVTAGADGTIFVNQSKVVAGTLLASLREAVESSEDKSVVFRGDGDVPYKTVVEVIDASRRAGAASFDIAHTIDPQQGDGGGS